MSHHLRQQLFLLALPIILQNLITTSLGFLVLHAPVAVVCLCIQAENICKMPWGIRRIRSRKRISDVTISNH